MMMKIVQDVSRQHNPAMAKLEDDGARGHQYVRHDSDWVNADLTLTTGWLSLSKPRPPAG